jgi:hypothetical protein
MAGAPDLLELGPALLDAAEVGADGDAWEPWVACAACLTG